MLIRLLHIRFMFLLHLDLRLLSVHLTMSPLKVKKLKIHSMFSPLETALLVLPT